MPRFLWDKKGKKKNQSIRGTTGCLATHIVYTHFAMKAGGREPEVAKRD